MADALSNRQRKALKKKTPAKPRVTPVEGAAVVKTAAKEAPVEKRDGLEWLVSKRRISEAQFAEGMRYRALFRDGGPVSMRSCLDMGAGGGAAGPKGYADDVVVASTAARQELDLIRGAVLRGQAEMLAVMDGVCGLGWTVRALAGGDQGRARELEALLRAALDQVDAWRGGKKAA